MSQNQLASALEVPANQIRATIKGARSITADTDLRLSKFFGLSGGITRAALRGIGCAYKIYMICWRQKEIKTTI